MALGTVQTGYRNSLYTYPERVKTEQERSYAEWLAELTTELELALEGGTEESVTDDSTEEDEPQKKAHSCLKREWEELLEQVDAVDAILRQMLEQGLGKEKEEQQPQEEKHPENLDNDLDMAGITADSEGKSKQTSEYSERSGNSEFLQTNSGSGAEYWNSSNSVKRHSTRPHTICLTCETECERKKQWKITE